MTFKVLDTVVLVCDLTEYGLCAGDLGAVVDICDSDRVEVEFVLASGKTQALVTLRSCDVRAASDRDLVSVRSVAKGAA
jgi:Domain of unknown function (DUF4926)